MKFKEKQWKSMEIIENRQNCRKSLQEAVWQAAKRPRRVFSSKNNQMIENQ